MGRAPGSVCGGFNSKKKSWQKAKKEKERQVRKRKGLAAKHKKVAVAGVSGSRTKKHAKKVARAQRLEGKEAAAVEEGAMQVEAAAPVKKPAAKKPAAKKLQKKGGKKVAARKPAAAAAPAADAPAPMQE